MRFVPSFEHEAGTFAAEWASRHCQPTAAPLPNESWTESYGVETDVVEVLYNMSKCGITQEFIETRAMLVVFECR